MLRARHKGAWLLGAAGLVGILAAPSRAQPLNISPPTLKANGDQICQAGRLDSERLANWYFYNHPEIAKNFRSADDLRQAFGAPAREQGARRRIIDNIATMTDTMVVRLHKDFQPNVDLAGAGDEARRRTSIAAFLAGQASPLVIRCKSAAPPVNPPPSAPAQVAGTTTPGAIEAAPGPPESTPETVLGNFRVRGSSDALLVSRDSADFASAAAATLSLSADGTAKSTTSALLATIGYDLHVDTATDSVFDVVPFIGVDRNISAAAGPPSASNRENVTAGVVASWSHPFVVPGSFVVGSNALSATYEHLWNDIDHSRLNFLHFVDLPVINGYLNEYRFFPCCDTPIDRTWFAASPLFDLRGDLGFYGDAGSKPAVNRDYQQVGSRLGIAITLRRIKSDVTVTETYLWNDKSTRDAVSLFEANWTYNVSADIGLKASYQNGDLEATAQRIQQWLISLSVKY
jgi:hypothetical protein